MLKEHLTNLFNNVATFKGFDEDTNKNPYLVYLGDDEYRSILWEGVYEGQRAMMTVSPFEDLADANLDLQAYSRARHSLEIEYPDALVIPEILAADFWSDSMWQAWYRIQALPPEGKRIVPMNRYPVVTDGELNTLLRIFSHTKAVFKRVRGFQVRKMTCTEYFFSTLNKRLEDVRRFAPKQFLDEDSRDWRMHQLIQRAQIIRMEYFFGLFGVTDIIESAGRYYIWNVDIKHMPAGMPIAYAVWNLILYGLKNLSQKEFSLALKRWIEYFSESGYLNEAEKYGFRPCLAERIFSTLVIDLPAARSPFRGLSERKLRAHTKLLDKETSGLLPIPGL